MSISKESVFHDYFCLKSANEEKEILCYLSPSKYKVIIFLNFVLYHVFENISQVIRIHTVFIFVCDLYDSPKS